MLTVRIDRGPFSVHNISLSSQSQMESVAEMTTAALNISEELEEIFHLNKIRETMLMTVSQAKITTSATFQAME